MDIPSCVTRRPYVWALSSCRGFADVNVESRKLVRQAGSVKS